MRLSKLSTISISLTESSQFQREARESTGQSSPIDPVLLNSSKQESVMIKKTEVTQNSTAKENSQIVPTETNLPTSANLASREPPCVSNQHENRLAGQTSPIDPVPLTSHNQDNAMPKKTEVTQHNAAEENYQIVPIKTNLSSKRAPRLKVIKRGDREVFAPDTSDTTEWRKDLAVTFGSSNEDLCDEMLEHIAMGTSSGNSPDAKAANFVLAFVAALKPRGPLEASLAIQIAAAHHEVMKSKRRLGMAKTDQQLDSEANRFTKLLRASSGLVIPFKNCNTGAPQTVTVQNVSVSDGGQAIVGNVTSNAGGTPSAADPPPVTIDGTALPLNDNQDVRRLGKGELK
jgi:hypothetical protein